MSDYDDGGLVDGACPRWIKHTNHLGALYCPTIQPDVSTLEKELKNEMTKNNGLPDNQAT